LTARTVPPSVRTLALLGPDQPHAEFVGRHWMPFGTADFDVRLGAAAQMREPQAIAARQVVSPPLEHRPDHRHEIDAGVGQHVFLAATLPGLTVGPARQ